MADRSLLGKFTDVTDSEALTRPTPSTVPTGEAHQLHAAGLLRQVRADQALNARERHHDLVMRDLDRRAMARARTKGVPALLDELADRGFSWRDIARLAQVSVPAVRKWRTGGTYSNARRTDLGRLAALCDLLDEFKVADPAGWMETPIVSGVPVSPIDLYLADRAELVVDIASLHELDPHHVLDEFDADWRSRYEHGYEVFEAADGELSIRAKRR